LCVFLYTKSVEQDLFKKITLLCKVCSGTTVLTLQPTEKTYFRAEKGMNKSNQLILSPDDFAQTETGYRLTERGLGKVAQQKRAALKRYAQGMVGNHWADDIVQNVFIKLLSQIFRDASAGVVMVWMFRVAHNESFDLVRKQERIKMPEQMPETPIAPDAYRWEARQRIDSIMSQLAPIEKACFDMIHQGFSYKEVGEYLSMTEDNVAVVVHRARKKIVAMAN
jgi:RNA polymerase sigma factor (sigma-70 family)